MKLATFKTSEKGARVGLIVFDGIVDLSLHLRKPPIDMMGLIADWPACQAQIEFIATNQPADLPFEAATILAPLPKPRRILSVCPRAEAQGREAKGGELEAQRWVERTSMAIGPPYGPIQLPDEDRPLDYGGELALVIGKRCRNATRQQAEKAIFGYSAALDFSLQGHRLDSAPAMWSDYAGLLAPFGPWIVTGEELENPHDLGIRCFVNGEKRQDSNTCHLKLDCFDQVRRLSQTMTLEPGDLIMTERGRNLGVRTLLQLKPGDVVQVEIERIGTIYNTVVAAARDTLDVLDVPRLSRSPASQREAVP